MMLLTSQIRRL